MKIYYRAMNQVENGKLSRVRRIAQKSKKVWKENYLTQVVT